MPTITFEPSGQTVEAAAGASFLDICQDNKATFDFGCTVGSCGTCRCEITAGAENVNPISEDERDTVEMATDVEGGRLGCQLVVNGDITVRAID